jgi:peptidoglycan/xylan/chitin deacetylase (PgdA/CDA1 family)
MKESFKNFAKVLGLAVSLEQTAGATPHEQTETMPAHLDRSTLPVKLSPGDKDKFLGNLENLTAFETQAAQFLIQTLGGSGAESVASLSPEQKLKILKPLFEVSRLLSSAARNQMLKYGELLTVNIAANFDSYVQQLAAVGIKLPNYAAVDPQLRRKKSEDLWKIYHDVNEMVVGSSMERQPPIEAKPLPKPVAEAILPPEQPVQRGGLQFGLEALRPVNIEEPPAPRNKGEVFPKGFEPPPNNAYLNRAWQQVGRVNEALGAAYGHEVFHVEGKVKSIDGRPTINLTFDDGPDTRYTPAVLDIIKNFNAAHPQDPPLKATFYLQGINITPATRAVINRIIAEGHEIALHSYNHANFKQKSGSMPRYGDTPLLVQEQLQPVERVLQGVLYKKLFRPPYGNITDGQVAQLAEQGYQIVNWTIDTHDWEKGATSQAIADRVTQNAYAGAIVLMHSGGGNRQPTVEALPSIINYLHSKNYQMVTTSAILGAESEVVNKH